MSVFTKQQQCGIKNNVILHKTPHSHSPF